MNRQSYLNPNSVTDYCNEIIAKIEEKNDALEAVRKSLRNFIEDEEIQSEAFTALKQQISDYLLVLNVLQGANDMDIGDCESLRSLVQSTGNVLIGENILTQEEAALQEKKTEEEKAEQFQRKAARTEAPLSWYYGMKSKHYRMLADASERLYQKWHAKHILYDEIDYASRFLFTTSSSLRQQTSAALLNLKKTFQNGTYITDDTACWRSSLLKAEAKYFNIKDWGQITEKNESLIIKWLDTDHKMTKEEIEQAKGLIDDYFAKGTLQYELLHTNNQLASSMIRKKMTEEEFKEYQRMTALYNKCSTAASFWLGAFSAIPFAMEGLNYTSNYIIKASGKTAADGASVLDMGKNSQKQHPMAFGTGAAAMEVAEGMALDGMLKGEAGVVDDALKGGAKTPSEIAKSWQGSGKYPGIDTYEDITLNKGEIFYRGEPNGTEYFTTESAIENSGRDATTIFEGLQVEKNQIHGYRSTMQGYMVNENVEAAIGITKANPQFGEGGLPQLFIPDVQTLIDEGILVPVNSIPLIK